METPPRHYVALAFLPVAIALLTLVALLMYQRGAEERRGRWQQPEAVLDAIGIGPAMEVAEWHPTDTYFLERLRKRVGADGSVYAVEPSPRLAQEIESSATGVDVVSELPQALDALLILHVSANDQQRDRVEGELRQAGQRLPVGARLGLIGLVGDRLDRRIGPQELLDAATTRGFQFVRQEDFLKPQFLLVLEKQ